MNSVRTKYCANCHAEVDSYATECLNCGCKNFTAVEGIPEATPKYEDTPAQKPVSSGIGNIFRVLATITWIGGFIWAIILATSMGAVGFFSAAIVFAISGFSLYAQAKLFDYVFNIYTLLKESKQK